MAQRILPISYYGGKQRMASKIIPLIPRHTVYCEPFCGGAVILFKKPWPKETGCTYYLEIINDIDDNLVNFYKQLRDNGKDLVEKISLTLYSESEYRISKTKNYEGLDDLERARRYFVNINQSFSGKLNSGWGRSVFSRNSAISFKNKVDNLSEFVERMREVHISNVDALKCIKQWDSPQTFFYVDPPYVGADQGHYGGYTEDDFKSLIDVLDNIQGSFLLSCYPNGLCPDSWEKFEFKSHCTASGKGKVGVNKTRKATKDELGARKRTEVIYRRFNKVPVRKEIQKLYDSGKYDCFAQNEEFLF